MTCQESINLERKSYLDCSSDTHCTREEFGRVTYWLQTWRSWRRWTHRKSTRKDSMRKRDYFRKKKENLFFQSQIDESKPLEEIRTWEHPPWYGIDLFKERVILTFLENQKGPPQPQDGCRWSDKRLWSMSGNFIYRHHVEPRVKLYSPGEESFTIPLKHIDLSRTTHTNLMSSKRNASMIIRISMGQETSLILGQVSHNLLYWKKKLLTDICGPGGD